MQYFEQQGRKINLLLGDGFSIAYDRNIFSYNSLSLFIMDSDDELVKRLFMVYNTQNFETIMQQLRNTVEVLKILDAPDELCIKVNEVSEDFKNKLIEAISTMHPEQVFAVAEEESKHCADGDHTRGRSVLHTT